MLAMIRRLRSRIAQRIADLAMAYLERRNSGELARRLESRLGYHLMEPHFYSPIPEESDFPDGFWDQQTELPGIRIDTGGPLALAEGPLAPFIVEFRQRFPLNEQAGASFWLLNSVYMAVDAHVYYALVRHLRPRRIFEIGSGMSTRLAAAAVAANRAEGHPCELTAIEPFPLKHVSAAARRGEFTLVAEKVQQVPIERFLELGPGDILF